MGILEEFEGIKDFTVQEVVEFFLAIVISASSLAFIAAHVSGYQNPFISLSVVFYSVMPVSIVIIAFLTYRVARMMYVSDAFNQGSFNALIMALLLAVISLNIGFVMVVLSSPASLSGGIGMFKMSFLIVILSLALSVSVLSRNMKALKDLQ